MKKVLSGDSGPVPEAFGSRLLAGIGEKRVTGRGVALAGALTMLALALFGITGVIWMLAGDGDGLGRAMAHYAPADVTGLPADEYSEMADMISGYLVGRLDEFQYTLVNTDGEHYNCFHNYEQIHMADCRSLLRLTRRTEIFCLILGAAGLILLLTLKKLKKRKRRSFAAAGLKALAGLGAVCLILGIWALVNFDGLFVTFHRIAFRNDHWLLNPETDMLIRLMPEELFIHLGLKGLPLAGGWILLLAGGCWFGKQKRKGLLPED